MEPFTMSAIRRQLALQRHFEVTAHRPQGDALVFVSASEPEAIGFAINYAFRHPADAVSVCEERYDPDDRLFKTRRVWFRAASYRKPRGRQKVVTVRR
jgi:hypothetical protein